MRHEQLNVIIHENRRGFTQTYNEIYDLYQPLIGHSAIALYNNLLRYVDNHSDYSGSGLSYPSLEHLAKKMRMSKHTLIKEREKLIKYGLAKLRVETYIVSNIQFQKFIYVLIDPLDTKTFKANHGEELLSVVGEEYYKRVFAKFLDVGGENLEQSIFPGVPNSTAGVLDSTPTVLNSTSTPGVLSSTAGVLNSTPTVPNSTSNSGVLSSTAEVLDSTVKIYSNNNSYSNSYSNSNNSVSRDAGPEEGELYDPGVRLIAETYEKVFSMMISPYNMEKLLAYVDDGMSEEVIVFALEKTSLANVDSLSYTIKILNAWTRQGVKTLEQAQEADKRYELKKGGRNHDPRRISKKKAGSIGESKENSSDAYAELCRRIS